MVKAGGAYHSSHDTPSASLRSAAPSRREPRRLRRSGRLRASPTGATETIGVQQPTRHTPSASRLFATSLSRRGEGASRHREAKSLPYGYGRNQRLQQPTQRTPSASLRSAAPSEREPRRLRRNGNQLNRLYHFSRHISPGFVKKAESHKKYQDCQFQFVKIAAIIKTYTGGTPPEVQNLISGGTM